MYIKIILDFFSVHENSFETVEDDALLSETQWITSKQIFDLSAFLGAVLAFINLLTFLYE